MADKNERWGVIRPVAGHCEKCAYNLGNPLKANCEMFVAEYNGDKPRAIHYEGKACPLFLEKSNESKS